MVNGHVAFVGDWYCGQCKHVLTQNCNNVPRPDERWDAARLQKQMDIAIEKAPKQIRDKLKLTKEDRQQETTKLGQVYRHGQKECCATEEEVHKLKRLLKGACISPLDKNDGKLHVCCPMLYKMAMDKVFDREDLKSYEVIQIQNEKEFLKAHKKGNISDSYHTKQMGRKPQWNNKKRN